MSKLYSRGQALVLVLGIIFLWEVLPRTGILDPILVPPFDAVMLRMGQLLLNGKLIEHALASLWRVLVGFTISVCIAVPLGIAIGLKPAWQRSSALLLGILRPISPPAWIPLAILWFGIGNLPAIFIVIVGTTLPLLAGVIGATQRIDGRLVKASLTLGASRRDTIAYVVLPAMLPDIVTQLRIGLGMAWMCVMAAEMVAVNRGLGYLMIHARSLFQTDTVFVGMIATGCMGYMMDSVLRRAEKKLFIWRVGLEAHVVLDY